MEAGSILEDMIRNPSTLKNDEGLASSENIGSSSQKEYKTQVATVTPFSVFDGAKMGLVYRYLECGKFARPIES